MYTCDMAPLSFWWGSDAPEPLSGETLDPLEKNMQKILVNAFLFKMAKMVNSFNSQNNYFRKHKMVLDKLFKFEHFSC